jgi:mono/diheme cytochrome c family protein
MRARAAAGTLVGFVAAALAFCAYVYASNQRMLLRVYPVAPVSFAAASGSEAVQRGKALADITGCTDCHGETLQGGAFGEPDWLHGHYYASNLTRKARGYSDADLDRIVRQGVRPDGRGVVAMPSFGFVRVTDAELADIVAFIRSVPVGGIDQPAHIIGPLDQWDLWREHFKPTVAYVTTERMKSPPDIGPAHEAGRHVVAIVCVECHGGDLKGHGWDGDAPDLRVVLAYDAPMFGRLLRTGTGADGKEHGLMSKIARDRLHKLTDGQIADVFAYLTARAKLTQ